MTTTATKFRTRPGRAGQPVPEASFRASRAAVTAEELDIQPTGGRFEAGLVNGVSLISRGEALGHGMWIDEVALDQVEELAMAADENGTGVKSRFTHPSLSADGTGKSLGRIHDNARDGDQVRGNLNLSKAAHKTPDGDLADYMMTLAKEDPASGGLSIVFDRDFEMEEDFMAAHGAELKEDRWGTYWDLENFKSPDPDNVNNFPHVRVADLTAADFVDSPAANPAGLFDRQPEARQMDACLSFALGLSDRPPTGRPFGIDPGRAQQFLHRWMEEHGVQLLRPSTDEDPEMGTATDTDATPAPTREELLAELNADLARYTEAFGAENGTAWFQEGIEFEEAQGRHIAALTEERDQLSERVAELEKDLADVKLGQDEPVDVGSDEDPEGNEAPKAKLTDFCKVPTADPSAN